MIELSSGEDDTPQISDGTNGEEDRAGTPGAEESSGAHVNDALNQPDADGRVLVNINHPSNERDLYLAPQIARVVKPHQVQRPSLIYHNCIPLFQTLQKGIHFGYTFSFASRELGLQKSCCISVYWAVMVTI